MEKQGETGYFYNIGGEIMTHYVMDEKGHKTAVLIDINSYEDLLEDIESLALIADSKNESEIPIDDVKKNLENCGIL